MRWAGVSNYDVPRLERCEARGHVQSLQPPFSMIRRDAGAARSRGARTHDTRRDRLQPDAVRTAHGHASPRSGSTRFAARRLAPPLARVPGAEARSEISRFATRCAPIAAKHGVSVAAVAVAWTLCWPITAAIVGARSPRQVDGWIAAAGVKLDASDLDAISAAIDATGAGTGPTRPAA